jgi:hypothetical protein
VGEFAYGKVLQEKTAGAKNENFSPFKGEAGWGMGSLSATETYPDPNPPLEGKGAFFTHTKVR